jgi:3-methyladenine DNA glycosylase AlkD
MSAMKNPKHFIRRVVQGLHTGGSRNRAQSQQRYFKEPVKRHGWRTADLRRYAAGMRREIEADGGQKLLFEVADKLFHIKNKGEEAHVAVMLLEPYGRKLLRGKTSFLGAAHFRCLERWIPHILSWDECDDLCHSVIGPMIISSPGYLKRVFVWARSRNRWSRRAACVVLVHSVRRKLYTPEVFRLAEMLLADEDDIVRKGLGWLLREMGKANPKVQVPFLMKIKEKAPRLVLRIACEKLPARARTQVLKWSRLKPVT